MIFQLILVVALGILAIYAYFQGRRSPVVSMIVLVLALAGATLALAPNLASDIARMVGIGRGADLVIYCFVLISLGAIFNLHIKLRSIEDNMTRIVRQLAQMNASVPMEGAKSEKQQHLGGGDVHSNYAGDRHGQ